MSVWYDPSVLENGLSEIDTQCNAIHLISSYNVGESWAVVTGKTLGSAAITGGTHMPAGVVPNGNNMRLVFDGVGATASGSDPGGTLHIAIVSGSVVLCVTEETSQQPITTDNPITFPNFYMQSSQPIPVV